MNFQDYKDRHTTRDGSRLTIRHTIRQFDSVAEMGIYAESKGIEFKHGTAQWFGNESIADVLRYAQVGNDSLVPEAEKILEKITADMGEITLPRFVPGIAGAYPCVPEYLMGVPEHMRIKANVAADMAPIRIFVSTTCSGDVEADTMQKRGVAILALAMVLSRIRPIELWIATYAGCGKGKQNNVVATRINTTPLDIAAACYALTSQGYNRKLGYGICCDDGGRPNADHLPWPANYSYGYNGDKTYLDDLRNRLGGSENDLFIAPVEAGDECVKNPVAWVNSQVERYRCAEDREEA